jgi:hypothetical protein
MVVLAQVWMEFTMTKSLQIAGEKNIVAPRHIRVYMDDIFGILNRLKEKTPLTNSTLASMLSIRG